MAQIMEFLLNLLLMRGRFLTSTAVETLHDVFRKCLNFKKKISTEYATATQIIGPFENMMELINYNASQYCGEGENYVITNDIRNQLYEHLFRMQEQSSTVSNLDNTKKHQARAQNEPQLVEQKHPTKIEKDATPNWSSRKSKQKKITRQEYIVDNLNAIIKSQELLVKNVIKLVNLLESDSLVQENDEKIRKLKTKLLACKDVLSNAPKINNFASVINNIIEEEITRCRFRMGETKTGAEINSKRPQPEGSAAALQQTSNKNKTKAEIHPKEKHKIGSKPEIIKKSRVIDHKNQEMRKSTNVMKVVEPNNAISHSSKPTKKICKNYEKKLNESLKELEDYAKLLEINSKHFNQFENNLWHSTTSMKCLSLKNEHLNACKCLFHNKKRFITVEAGIMKKSILGEEAEHYEKFTAISDNMIRITEWKLVNNYHQKTILPSSSQKGYLTNKHASAKPDFKNRINTVENVSQPDEKPLRNSYIKHNLKSKTNTIQQEKSNIGTPVTVDKKSTSRINSSLEVKQKNEKAANLIPNCYKNRATQVVPRKNTSGHSKKAEKSATNTKDNAETQNNIKQKLRVNIIFPKELLDQMSKKVESKISSTNNTVKTQTQEDKKLDSVSSNSKKTNKVKACTSIEIFCQGFNAEQFKEQNSKNKLKNNKTGNVDMKHLPENDVRKHQKSGEHFIDCSPNEASPSEINNQIVNQPATSKNDVTTVPVIKVATEINAAKDTLINVEPVEKEYCKKNTDVTTHCPSVKNAKVITKSNVELEQITLASTTKPMLEQTNNQKLVLLPFKAHTNNSPKSGNRISYKSKIPLSTSKLMKAKSAELSQNKTGRHQKNSLRNLKSEADLIKVNKKAFDELEYILNSIRFIVNDKDVKRKTGLKTNAENKKRNIVDPEKKNMSTNFTSVVQTVSHLVNERFNDKSKGDSGSASTSKTAEVDTCKHTRGKTFFKTNIPRKTSSLKQINIKRIQINTIEYETKLPNKTQMRRTTKSAMKKQQVLTISPKITKMGNASPYMRTVESKMKSLKPKAGEEIRDYCAKKRSFACVAKTIFPPKKSICSLQTDDSKKPDNQVHRVLWEEEEDWKLGDILHN